MTKKQKTDRPSRAAMIRAIRAARRAELERVNRAALRRMAVQRETIGHLLAPGDAVLREILAASPSVDEMLAELLAPSEDSSS